MKNGLYYHDPSGRIKLVCPRCGEELSPLDVENYPACPYCDLHFPEDAELESFILNPVIRSWTAHAGDSENGF